MNIKDGVAKLAESSRARIAIFAFLVLLIGSFTFLAFRARTNFTASREIQSSLAQQTQDIHVAGSMDDFYKQSWLANDQNFIELAGYISRLINLPTSQPLDPKFKQELNDYIEKNRPQLSREAIQINGLSFSEGILQQDQSRLLDMYDDLSLLFRIMEDVVSYWDLDSPQEREAKISSIQEAFYFAGVEFRATTSSHQRILKYAQQLGAQSKQANVTELDRMQASRTQFTVSVSGLIVSVLLLVGWIVFLVHRQRMNPSEGGEEG